MLETNYTNKIINNYRDPKAEGREQRVTGAVVFNCINCKKSIEHHYDREVTFDIDDDSKWSEVNYEEPFGYGFDCPHCEFGYYIESTQIQWTIKIMKFRINADDYL